VKPFIIAIYALFLFAMISGLVAAFRNADGLVEPDYYLRQSSWFREKTEERRIGLEVRRPASIRTGENELTFVLTEHGNPLTKAAVKLFIGKVQSSGQDVTHAMRETAPGIYKATVDVPARGKWLVRIDLSSNNLTTSKSWFYDVY